MTDTDRPEWSTVQVSDLIDDREMWAKRALAAEAKLAKVRAESDELRRQGYPVGVLLRILTDNAHPAVLSDREAERVAYLDARQAAMQKDREEWFADYDVEPGIVGDAFVRGWDAAVDGRFDRDRAPIEVTDEALRKARIAVHQALATNWATIAHELGGDQVEYNALLNELATAALTAALAEMEK